MHYNLIPYKIRVIANKNYFNAPKIAIPFDVEGTCLSLNTQGITQSDNQFKEGNIFNLLFKTITPSVSIIVRWDNDKKGIFYSGQLKFRSGNITLCNSIWDATNLNHMIDTRHYSELKSNYYSNKQVLNIPYPTLEYTKFASTDLIPRGFNNALIREGNSDTLVVNKNLNGDINVLGIYNPINCNKLPKNAMPTRAYAKEMKLL